MLVSTSAFVLFIKLARLLILGFCCVIRALLSSKFLTRYMQDLVQNVLTIGYINGIIEVKNLVLACYVLKFRLIFTVGSFKVK